MPQSWLVQSPASWVAPQRARGRLLVPESHGRKGQGTPVHGTPAAPAPFARRHDPTAPPSRPGGPQAAARGLESSAALKATVAAIASATYSRLRGLRAATQMRPDSMPYTE